MKVKVKVMINGTSHIEEIEYDENTEVQNLMDVIEKSNPFDGNPKVIFKGKPTKPHTKLVDLIASDGDFFVYTAIKQKQNSGPSTEPLPVLGIAPSPAPSLKDAKKDRPSDADVEAMVAQLMELGCQASYAYEYLHNNNYDFVAARDEFFRWKLERKRNTISQIEELRREITSDPRELERIIRSMEREHPEKGLEMRNDPSQFLREIHLNPNDFPLGSYRNRLIRLPEDDKESSDIEGENDIKKDIAENESVASGDFNDEQLKDIAELMNLGFDEGLVIDVYNSCRRNVAKAASFLTFGNT